MDNDTANIFQAYNLASYNVTLSLSKIALLIHHKVEPDRFYYEKSLNQVKDLQLALLILEDWLYKQTVQE